MRDESTRKLKYKKSSEVYHKTLPLISHYLNKVHEINFSIKHWECILGEWLRYFSVIYIDRKENISTYEKLFYHQVESSKNTGFITRDSKSFYHLTATRQFNNKFCSDIKNKISFNNVIEYFDVQLDNRIEQSSVGMFDKVKLYILKFYKFLENIIFKISIYIYKDNSIILISNSFSRFDYFKFYILSFGKVLKMPNSLKMHKKKLNHRKKNIRYRLINEINKNEIKKKLFLVLLIKHIPSIYLEDFKENIIKIKLLPVRIKCFYTDGNHHSSEFIKQAIGYWKSKNNKIIIGQHAGPRGLFSCDTYFDYDKSIASKFLSWGWSDNSEIVKPFISTRLSKKKNEVLKGIKHQLINGKVTYVCRAVPSLQLGCVTWDNSKFSKKIREGRSLLSSKINNRKLNLWIRTRPQDVYGDKISHLAEEFQSCRAKYYPQDQTINSIYNESKLLIFESISTGFLECLSINKPVLIYLNENYFPFDTLQLKEFLKVLKELGLIFFDSKSLLTEIYNFDQNMFIKKYKSDRMRQLKQNFLKTSRFWHKDLFNELTRF